MFIDARKAHLNPRCEEDVYVQLPEECGCPAGMCGKLEYWLYGFRKAKAEVLSQIQLLFLALNLYIRVITCPFIFTTCRRRGRGQ